MSIPGEMLRVVQRRAGDRCEYCRMHQSLQGAAFHVEHITPRSRGGDSAATNLAWCCPSCNFAKSNRVAAVDPESGISVALFHPRRDEWSENFQWNGYELIGRTAAGRATAEAFDLNHPRRLLIRRAEELFGLFPV